MASSIESSNQQDTLLYSYGSHKIDLGKPYLHRLNISERKLLLYSEGGMGLEPSPLHRITLEFEANQTADLIKLEDRISRVFRPHSWILYTKSTDSSPQQTEKKTPFETQFPIGGKILYYRITATKIFKRIYPPEQRSTEAKEISHIPEYEELTAVAKIDLIKIAQIKGRLSQLLEKRKDLKTLFIPFLEQLNILIKPNRYPSTYLELEILDNKLEILPLKQFLTATQWKSFKNYLWGGDESGADVLLSIPQPFIKTEELCKNIP